MCRAIGYKANACGHRWLVITTRCAPNMGFTNTPYHEFRVDGVSILGNPQYEKAPAGTCPNCDRRGQYDGNTIRMVLGRSERGIRDKVSRDGMIGAPAAGYMAPGQMQMAAGQPLPGYAAGQPVITGVVGQSQVLSPYQMQFAAQQQAMQAARMQYYPSQDPKDYRGGSCRLM